MIDHHPAWSAIFDCLSPVIHHHLASLNITEHHATSLNDAKSLSASFFNVGITSWSWSGWTTRILWVSVMQHQPASITYHHSPQDSSTSLSTTINQPVNQYLDHHTHHPRASIMVHLLAPRQDDHWSAGIHSCSDGSVAAKQWPSGHNLSRNGHDEWDSDWSH